MKYLNKLLPTLLLALLFTGCDDSTGSLGIFATQDGMTTSTDVFEVSTRSISTGAIVADNSHAYLGNVIDPETGASIKAECAQQFYCLEDYELPAHDVMVGNVQVDPVTGDTISIERDVVQCDSCEVRIYLDSYYGLGGNPMKLEVFALDSEKILEEGVTYRTDTDLSQYVTSTQPLATKVFTPEDYVLSDGERNSSTHNANIHITMPRELGQRILEKYYQNPSSFKDSYHFIREVFPGFYFRIKSGEGTMITTLVSTFNIYYDYVETKDSKHVYQGVTRFSATPEVIQSTRFFNGDMQSLVDDHSCTYLKTPAGICTEMTLPIDEIFNQHPTDSVSMAQITLTRYNKDQNAYQLGTPSEVLMVRKQDMERFFANKSVSDSRTSYTTTFNSTYNTYTFNNICRLLAYCKHEKMKGAADAGITEAEWAALHPDWNKVVIVPVVTSSNSSGNQTSVNHDMQMNSVRLVGGDTKLQMQVVYSKFYQ